MQYDFCEELEATPVFPLRMKSFSPEWCPDESQVKMYNVVEGKTCKEVFKSAQFKPVICIREFLWVEIQYITHHIPDSEFAVFLVLKKFDPNNQVYIAEDMYFPKQSASAGGVSIDTEDSGKFFKELKEVPWFANGKGFHRYIAHLHSHGNMGVFWSTTDRNQQESGDDLGFYDDFRYYLVVNTHDRVLADYVQYKPVALSVQDIPVVIVAEEGCSYGDFVLSNERKAELDKLVSEKLSKDYAGVTEMVPRCFEKADVQSFSEKQPKPVKWDYNWSWTAPRYNDFDYSNYNYDYDTYNYTDDIGFPGNKLEDYLVQGHDEMMNIGTSEMVSVNKEFKEFELMFDLVVKDAKDTAIAMSVSQIDVFSETGKNIKSYIQSLENMYNRWLIDDRKDFFVGLCVGSPNKEIEYTADAAIEELGNYIGSLVCSDVNAAYYE